MRRNKLITFIILIVLFPLAHAIPPIPEAYYGVAYINGEPAPKNTKIMVKSASGEEWSTTVRESSVWHLDVIFDDSDTSTDEGALEGELLAWFIQDRTAYMEGVSEDRANSGFLNTNLVLYSGTLPTSSTTVPQSTSTSVKSEQSTSSSLRQEEVTSTVGGREGVVGGVTTVPSALSNLLSFRRGETTTVASPPGNVSVSCSDGVRNNGEEGVDCGGPCQPCKSSSSNKMVWLVVGGVVLLALFLVFALFLLFLVYSLAKKKGK